MDEVILVDQRDREVGCAEKLDAHVAPGMLHRALSAFVFNGKGELLLQRRARTKYHFAGLWSNSCCTHPRPGEAVEDAARRRTFEELGLECELTAIGSFTYQATDRITGLVENEFDHVLVGVTDARPVANEDEVDRIAYVGVDLLREHIKQGASNCTPWLPRAMAVLDVALPRGLASLDRLVPPTPAVDPSPMV